MWRPFSSGVFFLIYSLIGAVLGYIVRQYVIPCILKMYDLEMQGKHWCFPIFEGLVILGSALNGLQDRGSVFIHLATLAFTIGVLMLAFIDAESLILPDLIIKPLWGLGFLVNSHPKGFVFLYTAVLSSLVTYISLYLFSKLYYKLTRRTGLGRGDIKLLGMLGAWFGFSGVSIILWIGCFSGLLWAALSLGFQKQSYYTPIPFGPFLVYGAFFYLFALEPFSITLY